MKTHNIVIFIGVVISLIYKTHSYKCDRTPVGIFKNRNRNDVGRWILDIPGNPKTYLPNQRYNISLKLDPFSMTHRTFKSFIITLEQDISFAMIDQHINYAIGHFEFGEDSLAKFSRRCPNTVIETNSVPKTEVQIFWVAPPKNSGCVAIKATVVESRDTWFSEDGPLTKILCEESSENENVQPMILSRCCACDEAKYEVAFEGLWTRNTHPKDFPSDVWSTRFSDVIGASHKLNSAFWYYGNIASDGLKELAEDGSTRLLESELKDMVSDNIRTIIKARGLQYPNITLSTYAVFRVDKQNHLVSLVSKISPSPDWIVGVSNLELCRPDCTWEENRVLNLYPWDAGTDDGIGYTSPDQPSIPRQPIRRIKSNSPNDPRSPFYAESGEDMKPIAKLYLTRQRLYEKACDSSEEPEENNEENDECATTDWGEWSPCTSMCGKGTMFRQRQYINQDTAYKCTVSMIETKSCYGQHCSQVNLRARTRFEAEEEKEEADTNGDNFDQINDPFNNNNNNQESVQNGEDQEGRCELTDWSEWSSCSSPCGRGTRTRDRKFKNPEAAIDCGISSADLQENEECDGEGNEDECENFEEFDENECPNTAWGEWSPCSVTCGSGTKERRRIPISFDEEFPEQCAEIQETVTCEEPACEDDESPFGRIKPGNHVSSVEILQQGPDGEVVDCKVSPWSFWSACRPNNGVCGKGIMSKRRQILIHASNGGKSCPKKLHKTKNCFVPCEDEEKDDTSEDSDTLPTWGSSVTPEESINGCIMSKWSAWSPCSTNCGEMAVRQRTRSIIRKEPGAICPPRLEQKK